VNTPVEARIRAAILRLRERGQTYEEVAAAVGVGRATVSRLLRLHRETGGIAPRPAGGGNPSPLKGAVADALCAIVVEHADATLEEITEMLVQRSGVSTSRAAVHRAMKRLGFSRKKSPSRQARETRPSIASATASSAKSSR